MKYRARGGRGERDKESAIGVGTLADPLLAPAG